MFRQMNHKIWIGLALATLLSLAVVTMALADQVVNTIDTTVDPDLETRTITAGGSTQVGFYIKTENNIPPGDLNGCNATGSSPATVNLSVPTGVTASSTSLTFTGCGTSDAQNVTFSSNTPGSYTISVASVTGGKSGSLWETAPAAFTLVVNPPADTTPPVISYTLTPSSPDGNNGWYKSNVTLEWSVTDPESPVTKTGCIDQSITADQDETTYTCSATSAGGSAGPVSVTIKRDATAPTASASASPAPNANGWNNTNVTVSFSGVDGLSGIASCSAPVVLSNEGAGQSASGTCTDKAGNVSALATASGIHIDKTPPTISGAPDRAANENGWYNDNVTVSFTCADTLSGVASCTGPQTLGEGANQSVSGTATDQAGNSASATVSGIHIDKTAPTISGAPDREANENSWYNDDVTVSFTCADTLSGVASCTGPQTLGEGANQSVSGTATDQAGNTASATVSGIHIDKTPPTISGAPDRAANENGWYNDNVTVSFTCADTLSGVASCTGPQTLGEGANQSVSGTATDQAGNSASATVSGIHIDKTAPTLAPSVSPNPALLNGSATADPGALDALSGIAAASCGAVDTSSVGSKSVLCTATDNAGNTASASASYRVIYATGGLCYGAPGHTILQPINADGSSVFKKGSTVPAKFRVCDAHGNSIGAPGVVEDFKLVKIINGTEFSEVNESVISTTPDTAFRWSASDQQWIFNINTKNLTAGKTYVYLITLNDGSTIEFRFGLK